MQSPRVSKFWGFVHVQYVHVDGFNMDWLGMEADDGGERGSRLQAPGHPRPPRPRIAGGRG